MYSREDVIEHLGGIAKWFDAKGAEANASVVREAARMLADERPSYDGPIVSDHASRQPVEMVSRYKGPF